MNNRTDITFPESNYRTHVPYLLKSNQHCSHCQQLLPENKRPPLDKKTHVSLWIIAEDIRYKDENCRTY